MFDCAFLYEASLSVVVVAERAGMRRRSGSCQLSAQLFFNPDVIKLKSPVIPYKHFPNVLIRHGFLVQKCSEIPAILFHIPTFLTTFQLSK